MHLIKFKGRQYSGSVNQNLLWKDGHVYLMDNHRAALWCWYQEFDLNKCAHNVLHIDRHTDALGANLELHVEAIPDIGRISVDEYLDAKVQLNGGECPLFRWDNYLSVHIATASEKLGRLISADHNEGDPPKSSWVQRPRPDELPKNISYWLSEWDEPWVVNIDLDYFFCIDHAPDKNGNDVWIPMFSNDYIDNIVQQLRDFRHKGRIKVITVCLTPSNFTPGWGECLKLSRRIFDILGAKHPDM